jgi:hypothetical protein
MGKRQRRRERQKAKAAADEEAERMASFAQWDDEIPEPSLPPVAAHVGSPGAGCPACEEIYYSGRYTERMTDEHWNAILP